MSEIQTPRQPARSALAPGAAAVDIARQMRAAVFLGDGFVEVHETPVPRPAAGQVLVRLEGCGVCASNLPVWSGKPWFRYPLAPGAPGHEGWGVVAAAGEGVDQWRPGDRVAVVSGNAYAEYDVAPANALVRLPEALSTMPLPGEPLACAVNIVRRSDIRNGHSVAVVGVGFIGALVVQLARQLGARVVALSRRAYALEVARACGADRTVATGDIHAATAAAQSLTDGAGFERVIEAGGEQATLDLASALVATGGRLVIAGYHQDGPRQIDMQSWNWRGIDVVNAHERDHSVVMRGMREAVDAVKAGRLDPSPLLTHRFSLEQLPAAFDAMRRRPEGFMKAVVAP